MNNTTYCMFRWFWGLLVNAGILGAVCVQAEVPPTAADLGLMTGTPVAAEQLVTAENFIDPPYNRWAFQHIRELFPTRAVPPSAATWELPRRSVAHYVPELRATAFGDASVQQVLDMTNSIAYDETYDDPESDIAAFIAAMYLGGEWRAGAVGRDREAELGSRGRE